MKKVILALFAIVGLVSAGCHAQVPPTSHTLTITVTNSPCTPGTPASTCGYVFSFATVSGSSCPSTSGSNYTPVNQSSPVAQPTTGNATYVDPAHAGQTVCAIGQTVAGSGVSQPSATIGPFTIPANPTAPALGTGTVSENKVTPQLQPTEPAGSADPQVAKLGKLELKAEVR